MGALEPRNQFPLPLCVPSPPPTPHAEAAKKMTCHAVVGAELEPELSAHTHTLRQTAAARAAPLLSASLQRHLPSCQLSLCTRRPITGQGMCPCLTRSPLQKKKKKRKNKSIPFGEIAGVSRRWKQCFLPGLKKKDAGYKPCSCQSELESTWVREKVLHQDRNWNQRSLVVIPRGLQGMIDWTGERGIDRKQISLYHRYFSF